MKQIRLPFPGKSLSEQEDDILLTSIIFLRTRDDIKQARIGVGCVIRNRVNNSRWWGKNYKQVILPLAEFYKLSEKEEFDFLYPIESDVNEKWNECYLIADGILNNSIPDNTFNSDFFFLNSEKLPEWLRWRVKKKQESLRWYVCTLGNIQFFRVELFWTPDQQKN